jgi:hypothetical protein
LPACSYAAIANGALSGCRREDPLSFVESTRKDLFWKGKLFPLKFTFLGQDVCVDLEVRCTYLNLDVYEKSSVMWMDTIVRIKLSP